MDRVLGRSIDGSDWGSLSPSDLAARVAARLFWAAADAGWAICVGINQVRTRASLWVSSRPNALISWSRRAPDIISETAIGGALTAFNHRWPITVLSSLVLAAALASQIEQPQAAPLRQATKPTPQSVPVLAMMKPILTPAPIALQRRLDALAAAYGEDVGIAVSDVTQGWVASVRGQNAFPQQSVSKLWVAMTALDAVDQGRMSLEQEVTLWPSDTSVFNQPISHQITEAGYQTTVGSLMRRALIGSDNAANDKLMALVGGPSAIQGMLSSKAISGIALAEDEKHLQARIIGLTWSQVLSPYGAFEAARAALPREARDVAMAAYLSNPYDGASPSGIVAALAALHRGELLSKSSTSAMLETMAKATTGPRRLRGGLPQGWSIAHKTGTGQDFRGSSIGINDVGLITAPDGRTYAVAVMMRRTEKPNPERMEFMQAVSRAVVEAWSADQPKMAQSSSGKPAADG